MKYKFFNSCVNWNRKDVDSEGGLSDMIESGKSITYETFRKNVDTSDFKYLQSLLGYPCGRLTMNKDWCVHYFRGCLHGRRVYWVNHSAIEYVFVPEDYKA